MVLTHTEDSGANPEATSNQYKHTKFKHNNKWYGNKKKLGQLAATKSKQFGIEMENNRIWIGWFELDDYGLDYCGDDCLVHGHHQKI